MRNPERRLLFEAPTIGHLHFNALQRIEQGFRAPERCTDRVVPVRGFRILAIGERIRYALAQPHRAFGDRPTTRAALRTTCRRDFEDSRAWCHRMNVNAKRVIRSSMPPVLPVLRVTETCKCTHFILLTSHAMQDRKTWQPRVWKIGYSTAFAAA